MITRLALRNLAANKGRFALTTFGVLLAVSFVVSALVLGDGLRRTFGDLTTDIVAGTDLAVRAPEEFGQSTTLTDTEVAAVSATPGVADAVGSVEAPENAVRPITPAGEEIPTSGPPQLAFSWIDNPDLSSFTLVEGQAPDAGEFVIDARSASTHDFVVGETYSLITPTGLHQLTLSGLKHFGPNNDTLGATLMSMSPGDTDVLFGTTGYESIFVSLTDDGRANYDATVEAVQQAVGTLDVVDQETLENEQAAEFNSQINLIQNILLAFGAVALLVSVLIIHNTFAMVLTQRTREMGLLRLVGAEMTKLRRSALAEAFVVGAIASVVGVGGGVAVAIGITALFSLIGVDFPDYPLIVSVRTVAVAVIVGLGVTMAATFGPTRLASRLSPIAALRDPETGQAGANRWRNPLGAVLLIGGLLVTGVALVGSVDSSASVVLLSAAATAVVMGVTAVSPALVGPVVAVARKVLDRFGASGTMAGRNASRQPHRTATSAGALMIGLAVVSLALVVGESLKVDLRNTLSNEVSAEYLLTDQTSSAGFPSSVAATVADDPRLGNVTGVGSVDGRIGTTGDVVEVTGVNLDSFPRLFDIGLDEAVDAGKESNSLLVHTDAATDAGLAVGDAVTITFGGGESTTVEVTALFAKSSSIAGDWLVDRSTLDAAGLVVSDTVVAFNGADSADDAEVATALAELETLYPAGDLETAGEFRERMEGLIDQVLSVLNMLVALAVVIALIGIANTLALAVNERTREIGLLRAVGMSRRQVRRMVRYEAAVVAGFGAVLGAALGMGFGWVAVAALPSDIVSAVAVPVDQIAVLLVVAVGAGLLAALLPARRAARMDVLEAIAH
jgi:putative ABC transport system permease protein